MGRKFGNFCSVETNETQEVGEHVLYQEDSDFVSDMITLQDDLVSVPVVFVTDYRIKVGNNSYSLQEVAETRLITEPKRMHRSSWIKNKSHVAAFLDHLRWCVLWPL